MNSTNGINHQFDEFIKSYPKDARDAILYLYSEMDRRNCKFGDQLIPTFLKPVFFSKAQAESISSVLLHIINILEKVTQLYFSHPDLREFFYIGSREAELIAVDPGYTKNVVIARPDSFLVNENLKFIEFNCDSPAGAGYTETEEDILKEIFPLKQLSDSFEFTPHHRLEYLLNALLGAYEEFAGKHKKPNIAIVDWREVRTQNEFCILASFFKKKGYDTVIADPRDLKFTNGKLAYNGFPIDLVYRRVIFKELMERFEDVQDFIKSYCAGKVCMVNPLRSRLASNKAILSIITNPKNYKEFFTDEENHIIQKHIPWTRRVLDIHTHFENQNVFLKRHIVAHKNHLVLKPSDSYGGKNVVIGRESGQTEWENLTNRILANKEGWVVQKYVDIPEIPVPIATAERIDFHSKKYNINPFIFGGLYAGSVARLSDQSVINVSAGGGLVPVIPCEEKPA